MLSPDTCTGHSYSPLKLCNQAWCTAQTSLWAQPLQLHPAGAGACGLSLADTLFVHLHLVTLQHFAAANAAYCCHLPATQPAARACVQLPLGPTGVAMVDMLLPAQPGALMLNVRVPCPCPASAQAG